MAKAKNLDERLPAENPVTALENKYEASGPIHQAVLDDPSTMICMEGARFSAKTWTITAKVVKYCVDYPGMEWLLCRYSKEDALQFLKPVFQRVAARMGHFPVWEDGAFRFTNGSFVTVSGLRSQDKLSKQAKVRGRDVAGLAVDQAEEIPPNIGGELTFMTRQPGYPHVMLISPNPPDEDSWIADTFPEDDSIPGRKYYRVSLYDNKFCPEEKLAELERLYPTTHIKYKKLILGLRGPDVTGEAIYGDTFDRALHVGPVKYDPEQPLLEAFDMGRHNPVWLAAQRNYFGGLEVLGAIMGKRMFMRDFMRVILKHREEWFGKPRELRTCCDPPPPTHLVAHTNIDILRAAKLQPRWIDSANAPDVREAVIQNISGLMQQRIGKRQAFMISDDTSRFLMASSAIVKKHGFFVNSCEGAYIWDDHVVSVGNKKVRQPIVNEWVDGSQRCLENIVLNFTTGQPSQSELEQKHQEAAQRAINSGSSGYQHPQAWLGY